MLLSMLTSKRWMIFLTHSKSCTSKLLPFKISWLSFLLFCYCLQENRHHFHCPFAAFSWFSFRYWSIIAYLEPGPFHWLNLQWIQKYFLLQFCIHFTQFCTYFTPFRLLCFLTGLYCLFLYLFLFSCFLAVNTLLLTQKPLKIRFNFHSHLGFSMVPFLEKVVRQILIMPLSWI
jgi:hypothetical protein